MIVPNYLLFGNLPRRLVATIQRLEFIVPRLEKAFHLCMRTSMNATKRELIRRTLQCLAESHLATVELMERTLTLLGEELGLDAVRFWRARTSAASQPSVAHHFQIDPYRLQVVFRGKACELGDTLFRLLQRLAKRPNTYVTHEDLLLDV